MYLHSLHLHAFGAFAGTVHVDFDAVGANGLFLLEGPTGVGKSTVIDAVVFALYGEMAGAVASRNRARSDFAAPDDPSFVDLVFEAGGGIFRVRRTPQYERAKQRGTGTTTQQATVKLWRLGAGAVETFGAGTDRDHSALDGAGELVAARLDEAGAEIRQAVGLTREQFAQTIVLPQGEFASFLRAKPEERTQLLQQVFQTGLYVEAQKALAERRRQLGGQVDEARRVAVGAVERLAALAPEPASPLAEQVPTEAPALSPVEQAPPGCVETPSPAWLSSDAPVDPPDAPVHPTAPDVLALADECRTLTDAVAAAAEQAAERARLHRESIAARVRSAEAQQALVRRRDDARARRDELEVAAPQVAVVRATVAAARRAAAVAQAVSRATAAHEARTAARGAWEEAADAARELGVAVPPALVPGTPGVDGSSEEAVAGAVAEDLAGWLAAAREDLVADGMLLDGLDERTAALADRLDGLQDLLDELGRLRAAVRADQDELAAMPAALEAIDARRSALATAAARLDGAETLVVAARRHRADLDRVLEALSDWRRAAEALATSKAAADEATVDEARLRLRRREGLAGELAGSLSPGDPCPVCGSLEHPHPAVLSDEHVSQEQVDAAEERRRAADEHFQTTNGAHEAVRERLDQVADRVDLVSEALRGDDTAADELVAAAVREADARIDEAVARRTAAAEASRELPGVQAERETLAAREAELRERTTSASSEHAGALARLEVVRAGTEAEADRVDADLAGVADRVGVEVTRSRGIAAPSLDGDAVATGGTARPEATVDRADVDPGGGTAESLAAETFGRGTRFVAEVRADLARVRVALRARQDAVGRWATAEAALVHARQEVRVRTAERDEALAAHGFASTEDVAAASLPTAELDERAATVDAHDEAMRAVAAELAVPDVVALPDGTTAQTVVAELVEGQESLGLAEQHEAEAREASTQARSRALTVAQHVAAVQRDVVAYREAVQGAAAVLRVADLVTARSADNGPALTLSTYVLVQRFESVVEAANRRLAVMSDGRYELERSDEREKKGGRNLGLALRVVDHVTGAARETTTLSGGETFYVSLCLALGLADVVSAEAGGIEFGTLFVDEGFGTLDPDKLDVVMTEITRLRDSGRVVGLVSHVEALKQMIPERIQVRRRADGASEVRVVA